MAVVLVLAVAISMASASAVVDDVTSDIQHLQTEKQKCLDGIERYEGMLQTADIEDRSIIWRVLAALTEEKSKIQGQLEALRLKAAAQARQAAALEEGYTAQKQEAAAQKQEAAAQKQEAAAQKQEVAAQKQIEVLQLQAELHSAQSKNKEGFSKVSSSKVMCLVGKLAMELRTGNERRPIILEEKDKQIIVEPFDWSEFPSENAATIALLKYHQEQLSKFGVPFGGDKYKMYDIHSRHVTARIVYEHKRLAQSGERLTFSSVKAQAILSLLGACAVNAYPLILDVTDGITHHLMQLEGDHDIWVWENLTPQAAYAKQAQMLKGHENLLLSQYLQLEDLPEDLQKPLKKARSILPSSQLQEQLYTLLSMIEDPAERFRTSFELFQDYGRSGLLEVPDVIRSMFI
eukprot:jgi/Chlat1/2433/Chrsp17S02830